MNNITIAGNLGRDAELRFTQSGKPVLGFAVAVEKRKGQDKTTLWVDCSLWGERGEKLAQYLTKGSRVCVAGEADVRAYEKGGELKAVLQVNVRELTLLGGGERAEGNASRGSGRPNRQERQEEEFDDGDSIPF